MFAFTIISPQTLEAPKCVIYLMHLWAWNCAGLKESLWGSFLPFYPHPGLYSLILERKEGGEGEGERETLHQSIASHMKPWGPNLQSAFHLEWNLQTFGVQDDAHTNWATQPGKFVVLIKIFTIFTQVCYLAGVIEMQRERWNKNRWNPSFLFLFVMLPFVSP